MDSDTVNSIVKTQTLTSANLQAPLIRSPRQTPRVRSISDCGRCYSFLAGASATLLLLCAAFAPSTSPAGKALKSKQPAIPATALTFLKQNCFACHTGKSPSGGLNLQTAPFHPDEPANFALWVKLYDRVSAGEMPPKGASRPSASSRSVFLSTLARPMIAIDDARVKREGRAVWRRMNRYEYENTLRDLLDAPWLQISEMLPEDGLLNRLNKVGEALDVSHVQMSRYMAVADYALREAMSPQPTRPETTVVRYYAREQRSFAGLARPALYEGEQERLVFPILDNEADVAFLTRPRRTTAASEDPAKREREAMGVVASAYEPTQPSFDQFRAPVAGRYRLRLCAHSFWAGPLSEKRWWHPALTSASAGRTNEPVTLYAQLPPEQLRPLGTVDVGPNSTTTELDVELLKGESVMPDAARFFRSRPPSWHNPLAQKDGQPGVAFQWLEVEGPLYDEWPMRGQQLMFGDLPIKPIGHGQVEVVSENPDVDSRRLIRTFMQKALRRPVQDSDVQPFVKLYHTASDAGASFTDSMLTAYTGVLCSPAFITLKEQPGPLDDYALASRLSYFLWNSEPDTELRALADRHTLHIPAVLSAQADRLLADPRSRQFVDAFLDYWLDLRKTDTTSPDEVLYPDYYLDDYLTQSSEAETQAFFAELVRKDLPARNLISSDFVMINERLAELYGLPGVQGSAIRRVELPKDSVRGGLLAQASVLKVTANGTTTSPVLRGVWINERILGKPAPQKPASVPAIEPDIRGATTIREQLAKHRTQPACNSCHAKIDPPGFALESFDVFGGWRDHYRALGGSEHAQGYGKNGQPFVFHPGLPVDASGDLADGKHFADVKSFRRLLLQDERQIARNLVQQLVTYSTGAPVKFGDRPKVEAILDRAKQGGYGVKSLIHGIIYSELFRNK